MKRLEELTEQDILALQDSEIEALIKFECANEGVKFEPAPSEPELQEVPEAETSMYYVDYLAFETKEQAQAYLDLIKNAYKTDYVVYGMNYLKKKNCRENIEVQYFYSSKEVADIATKVYKSNESLEKSHKEDMKLWTESRATYNEIVSKVYDRVGDVRQKYSEMNHFLSIFTREYLPLANNDADMAMSFLKKAYTISDETESYINSNK